MRDRTKLANGVSNALGGVVALVYGSAVLLASALVVHLAGVAGTGLGWTAMAISTLLFTGVGSWLTAPYLDQFVERVLGVDTDGEH